MFDTDITFMSDRDYVIWQGLMEDTRPEPLCPGEVAGYDDLVPPF